MRQEVTALCGKTEGRVAKERESFAMAKSG